MYSIFILPGDLHDPVEGFAEPQLQFKLSGDELCDHDEALATSFALGLYLSLIVFRLHGFKIMSHFDAVLYTARRFEMCEIVESTLFFLRDRPQVHSEVSGLPFMVS